jgi:hypothetical protein
MGAKMIFIDNDEILYTKYLGNYEIEISEYANKDNIMIKYLLGKYELQKEGRKNIAKISEADFSSMITELRLIEISESYYLILKQAKIFIRKEDFKYTMIINRQDSQIIETELSPMKLAVNSVYVVTDEYEFYKKIEKEKLLEWINETA